MLDAVLMKTNHARARMVYGLLVLCLGAMNLQQSLRRVAFFSENAASPFRRIPRRFVILFGPHDRYNFGDLLFEKVVYRLLTTEAGYLPNELLSVGMIHTNMSRYGGNPNVISVKQAVEMSHQAILQYGNSTRGPFDVIFLGGESIGCTHFRGMQMLHTKADRQQAQQNKVSNCAYLFPKQILVPANMTNIIKRQSVAVVNSIGGGVEASKPCKPYLRTADYVAFRDLGPNATLTSLPIAKARPDAAVMVDVLFREIVSQYATETSSSLHEIQQQAPHYVAVQLKAAAVTNVTAMATLLDTIHQSSNLTPVFFLAGSAPNHDSLDVYRAIGSQMNTPWLLFAAEHVWMVVALISRATAVISTSLHVRIMAAVYHRPRVTLCTAGSTGKHQKFISLWDAVDATPCAHNIAVVLPMLQTSLQTPVAETQRAMARAIASYRQGFAEWSSLLD